jgi:undecaprenyl-diphosphatase
MNLKNTKIKILDLDLRGCLYFNNLSHTQSIALVFKIISRLGDGTFWFAMVAIMWLLQGPQYTIQVLYIVTFSSIGTLIYKILKTKTVRPRPYQVHQVIRIGERPLDHFSFPSGHTLHAVMAMILIGYVQPLLLFIMLPFTVLVALSRMVLGLHYPTDVLVGAIIGATVASGIILVAPSLNIML